MSSTTTLDVPTFGDLGEVTLDRREEQGIRGIDKERSRFRAHIASAAFFDRLITNIARPLSPREAASRGRTVGGDVSCGDCDWGCTMPGCGKKMAYCAEHYDKLTARLETVEHERDWLRAEIGRALECVNAAMTRDALLAAQNILQTAKFGLPKEPSHPISPDQGEKGQ